MPWTTALDNSLPTKLWKSSKLIFLKTLLLRVSHNVYKNYKTSPAICTVRATKIYLYHSTKTAKAKPHRVEIS